MNLQTQIDNMMMAERVKELADMDVLTLGELLIKLESLFKPDEYECDFRYVKFDFKNMCPTDFRSWRGIYREISIGYDTGVTLTLDDLIRDVKNAIGHIYTGYKGGEFTMSKNTPVWVANYGESGITDYNGTEYATVGIVDVKVEGEDIILVTKEFRD